MDTPESSVFLRREGTGDAQIFGNPSNPLGALGNYYGNKERRAAVQAAQVRQEKLARDKRVNELLDRDPEKTFEPFNQQLITAVDAHRKEFLKYVDAGGNPNTNAFQVWNKNKWAQLDDIARRGNFIKDEITNVRNIIKADKNLDSDYYNSIISDHYMDHSGNGVPIDKVDVNALRNVVAQNPEGVKLDVYTKGFMSNVKKNVLDFHDAKLQNGGINTKDTVTKIMGTLYTPDSTTKSGVKEDGDGNPIVNVTPDFKAAYMANENVARAVKMKAEKENKTEEDIIREMVSPGASHEQTIKESQKFFPRPAGSGGGGYGDPKTKATRRLQNIGTLAYAFTDGEGYVSDKPTPEAEKILGYIKGNAKHNGGEVLDANFEAANEEKQTPNRIAIKVKQTRGLPKMAYIDLTNPAQAASELNSIFETSKTEGGFKIGHDILRDMDAKDFGGKILDRELKFRPGTVNEKKMLDTIDKWSKGEGFDEIIDKKFDGQKIVSATHESPWFGDKRVTLELANGTKVSLNPTDSQDRAKLEKVYMSQFRAKAKLAGEKGVEVLNDDFWNN